MEYKIVTRTITSCHIFRRKMIQQKEVKMEQGDKIVLDQTRKNKEMDLVIKHYQLFQIMIPK